MKYNFEKDKKAHTINEITELIRIGKNVVLTGEYGSGKSRCLREAFITLAEEESSAYFLAIDLKTTWGLQWTQLLE